MDVNLASETLGSLNWTAALAQTTPKALAAWLTKGALVTFRRELEKLEQQAGALWLQARPFLPYVKYLAKPGDSFRVHEKTLRHEDWAPIQEGLALLHGKFQQWGWSEARRDRFIRRAAERCLAARPAQSGSLGPSPTPVRSHS